VLWRGRPVVVTSKEFWLLEALVRNKNRVLTAANLRTRSTAGATKSKAMRSRFTSTTCVASFLATSSRPSGAPAMPPSRRPQLISE